MTPESVRQVEELFHAVAAAPPEQHEALLAEAGPEVRRKVESLLGARTSSGIFDSPAIHLVEDSDLGGLAAGARLGPYRIVDKLGEGGMGEVFRAIDTRLGREVAIKIVDERFACRFDREGRALSSLNHPNICTLYDVGPNYLVMELVEGETLASRLKRGPLDLDTIQHYGRQIAAGLAAAHSKGLTHRDLKPGNIMVGPAGIKILDFGLAKSEDDEAITGSSMIMGTPAYMSPEQKEGKQADARSDIYAFGRILQEMSTRRQAGSGRKRVVSRGLDKIVKRCLEAAPERRWQSAAEIEGELGVITPAAGWWPYVIVAAGALVALCGAVYFHALPSVHKLTDKDTVVLADIVNRTGDAVFDDTLRNGLAVALDQSPFLKLISDDKVRRVLTQMGRDSEQRLTPALAREVCERTGSAAVLEGSIAMIGSRYVLWLRARTCQTGEVIDEEQMEAAAKENVLGVLSQIAQKLRKQVGESLASVEKHSTTLDEATTHSLEAFKLYTSAQTVAHSAGLARGVPLLNRAIELDPEFALAHAHLGLWLNNLQEPDKARVSATRAYDLRKRTTDREQFFITANYHRQVTGDLEKTLEALELWAETYPRDVTPHAMMSGYVCQSLGKFDKAIEEGQKAIAIDPDFTHPYLNLAFSHLFRDQVREAEIAIQQANARKLQFMDLAEARYYIAFLKGDQTGMDREPPGTDVSSGLEARIIFSRALSLARVGRLRAAVGTARHAMETAQHGHGSEMAAVYLAGTAVWEGLFGNHSAAKRGATAALGMSNSRDVEFAAAYSLATAGDWPRAQALINDLERRFSEDTSARFSYLPVLRGALLLARGRPSEAIAALPATGPMAAQVLPAITFSSYFGSLYPEYVRGEALLAVSRSDEAVVEFQKIVNARGRVLADPLGMVARLQLARALATSGQMAQARIAYEDFLSRWRDADPDIPVLRQAKTEYSKIRKVGS